MLANPLLAVGHEVAAADKSIVRTAALSLELRVEAVAVKGQYRQLLERTEVWDRAVELVVL